MCVCVCVCVCMCVCVCVCDRECKEGPKFGIEIFYLNVMKELLRADLKAELFY